MGGLSREREVSLSTGKAVVEAIKRKGLNAVSIDVDLNIADRLQKNKIDLAFIALHGTYGEDGAIQGLLECLRIPYTGSGILGSALAYDKLKSKEFFKLHGIPTADYEVFYKDQRSSQKRMMELPVVVKPPNQGSSIGISIVRAENEWEKALDLAFSFSDEVLAEQYIQGKLLAVGMIGEKPLPIVEIRPKSGFYDYEAKYTAGLTEYICPAELDMEEIELCEETAIKVYRTLKGRGVPRVDMILDNQGIPWVLEMNTIPGMTATSLLPMAAKQSGIGFDDLVIEILIQAQLDNQG